MYTKLKPVDTINRENGVAPIRNITVTQRLGVVN